MKRKRVLYFTIASVMVCYVFIWCKFHFFTKVYTQEEINKEFAALKIDAPLYDSVNIRGYSIKYISNKKNYSVKGDEFGKKKPYLVVLHNSDKNAGYFIDYFKNKTLNQKFHIIAIDRIGFGNSTFKKPETESTLFQQEKKEFGNMADYASGISVKEVLDAEGQYMEEVRIVADGSGGMAGLTAYLYKSLSFSKVFLFDPEINDRFFLSKILSKIVTSPVVSPTFPRAYVSKHHDLLLADDYRGKEFAKLIKNVQSSENREAMDNSYMYPKGFKSVFFFGLSEKEQLSITEISGKSNFVFQENDLNIYSSPEKVLKTILANDIYTLTFNRIR
ncbi:hypothetical protein [Pedobacter agri]|uniref:alpha/beta fold hydrolase n=1 Tax=Pedobacter agri TaxID=454586 RepID=UPI002931E9C5|nr:hypothetical protein [Pedobacter agri]